MNRKLANIPTYIVFSLLLLNSIHCRASNLSFIFQPNPSAMEGAGKNVDQGISIKNMRVDIVDGREYLQWIELVNHSEKIIQLNGWILQNDVGSHVITENTILLPYNRIFLVRSREQLHESMASYYTYGDSVGVIYGDKNIVLLDILGRQVFAYEYASILKKFTENLVSTSE